MAFITPINRQFTSDVTSSNTSFSKLSLAADNEVKLSGDLDDQDVDISVDINTSDKVLSTDSFDDHYADMFSVDGDDEDLDEFVEITF